MGGVVSCIKAALRTIGDAIMAVISGIGGILQAIISAIVRFCGIIVRFLTCGYCGSKRHGGGTRTSRRSRV
ncbi:hypothetical protein BGZ61DRAFT_591029 [Ilyonectria robusta]|uniref:uncharacterized protein n=1 Tax=Ilyonectria robusta TaxID=1079257 RepID=UPI001E8CA954|nr:uncharacterized protein BGZ61DRAFT_591029 [Ilyonectria robusta]KAH6973623.1 hypothetical protein BKA56DRAFT_676297 [Ilyonectria sp. MPI-CAGE-AT-0026]KAH8676989.1 hypothetical protein BGZ61DRAFT_591029 [Ilyonectria robusta]